MVIDFLGGGNSNIFHVHPEPWGKMNPFWLIFFIHFHHQLENMYQEKTRSRRDYGPADFGSLQTEPSVKLTPLAAFLIFIKKTMWPFWWYLRDSEAVKS